MARYVVLKIDEKERCVFMCKETIECKKCKYFGRSKESLVHSIVTISENKINRQDAEFILEGISK